MSLIIAEAIVDKNDLPEDIFTYNHERFYEFIEQQYGIDLAELFRFQAIRNATHLLNTSCDDIISILQLESNDIKVLKNLCCFQIAGDKYKIKLGVKLALKNFIELVKIKQQQQQKKKKSSIQPLSINRTQPQPQTQTLVGTSNETTDETQIELPTLPSIPSKNDTSLTRSRLTTLQKKLNELDHIADIENRINK
ncbi:unnamed protein product [Rotaria sp. Silwood2]|nr:unnamed protein product [Rotaria sp. Silwood2]CAF4343431.1 unnamed protein product [Rotaria sp. Silwood2]